MTALDQTTSLSADRLAEIRRRDEISLGLAEKPDWPLGQAEWDRTVLLAEVDRLNKVVEFLGSQLQGGAEVHKHLGQVVVTLGEVMQNAASTAAELGTGAGMDIIIGYLSDAGMLPSAVQADPHGGETP